MFLLTKVAEISVTRMWSDSPFFAIRQFMTKWSHYLFYVRFM